MRHVNFFISLLIVLVFKQSFGQLTEKNYRIYSVKAGKEINLQQIADDMNQADVLFFGEEHNDSVTHYLEKTMLEKLFASYPTQLTLSLEMFERDVQPVMDEYLGGYIREKSFKKDARVWSNYKDYRPMVEFAKDHKLDVVCANAASRYTNLAGRKGQAALMELPKASKSNFAPLPYDTASGKYYEKLMMLSGHGASQLAVTDTANKSKMPVMSMGNFNLVVSQSLWDATMAYSISSYLKKHKDKKIMQVNGRFHSDEGFAVVTQLKKYRPKTRVLIISSGTDEKFPNIDWKAYTTQGDYIIITDPSVPRTYEE